MFGGHGRALCPQEEISRVDVLPSEADKWRSKPFRHNQVVHGWLAGIGYKSRFEFGRRVQGGLDAPGAAALAATQSRFTYSPPGTSK